MGTFGEQTINDNGRELRQFATYNQLKSYNSFFRNKDTHKYTWTARGLRSVIDYIMVNSKLKNEIPDIGVYRGKDI